MTKNERQKLVIDNMRLVYWVIKKQNYYGNKDDIEQAGMEGLVYAAKVFDPERGAFSTIATLSIKQRIHAYLFKQDQLDHGLRATRAGKTIRGKNAYDRKADTYEHIAPIVAIDAIAEPSSKEEESFSLEINRIEQLLAACCKPRERRIIRLYFYEEMSVQKIGDVYGLTHQRVAQIIKDVITKLKLEFERDPVRRWDATDDE